MEPEGVISSSPLILPNISNLELTPLLHLGGERVCRDWASHKELLDLLGIFGQEVGACCTPSAWCWSPVREGACVFCWSWLTWRRTIPAMWMSEPCLPCSTGVRHPLGMVPCAEAIHAVAYPVGGFYLSLAGFSLPDFTHRHHVCVVLFLCQHAVTLMFASLAKLFVHKLKWMLY